MSASRAPALRPDPRARVLTAVLALLALATAAGFAETLSWRIALLVHFRMQYAVAALVVTGLALWIRQRAPAAIATVVLVVNAMCIAPVFVSAPRGATEASRLRLSTFNVHRSRAPAAAVAAYLEREAPDVALLLEVQPRWLDELGRQTPSFRTVHAEPRRDAFGIALLSRESTELAQVHDARGLSVTDSEPVPTVEARLRFAGRPVALLGLHAMPPTSARAARLNREAGSGIVRWARGLAPAATVVVGDLNATPWSSAFARILSGAALVDSGRGFGWQPTYDRLGGLPIDHVLHDARLVTRTREVGPDLGSDHRPLAVELSWRR